MTEFQKITHEIRQLQVELNHLGSCNTKDLTAEQIAHIDERFFLAIEKQSKSKFQPIHTKHWRFDFHIVKLRLLIEIEGGPWSGGRGGKLSNKAWSLDRYDQAEEMGYKIERFHPDSILSGYVINWIKSELARIEDGANKTISTD